MAGKVLSPDCAFVRCHYVGQTFLNMFEFFRSKKADVQGPVVEASVPDGHRVYAMGDVHGCSELFLNLIEAIEVDNRDKGPAKTTAVLLGDLVDRGPDSASVLALAREWQKFRDVRILAGNHEEMFLRAFEDDELLRHFLRHGGRETLLSYGVDKRRFLTSSLEEIQQLMNELVPQADRDFIASFENIISIGDYIFVHAGIQPGLALEDQEITKLRWIREPFLSHMEPHAGVVVHGHTITEMPVDQGNRIGIDTGAYNSGRLTALVLEGDRRRYISAVSDEAGGISIVTE